MTSQLPTTHQSLSAQATSRFACSTRRQFGHALTGLAAALALAACGGGGSVSTAADAGTGSGAGTGTGTGSGTGTNAATKGFSVQIIAGAPSWKVFSDYGTADGTGTAARFHNIQGLAQASNGDIWVSDTDNNTLRRITSAGVVTTPYGQAGAKPSSVAGKGSAARFASPAGLAILKTASAETLYVAESGSGDAGTTNIRAIDLVNAGDATILKLAGGSLVQPQTIAAKVLGGSTILWVGEYGGALRKISAGNVSTLIPAGLASMSLGVVVNAAGDTVYEAVSTTIADVASPNFGKVPSMVVQYKAGVQSVLAGDIKQPGKTDGAGAAARFDGITGMTIDSKDNLYVADAAGIRKITPAGVVSTVVGFADTNGVANANATTQWDDTQGPGRPAVLLMVSDTEMLAANNTQVLRITLP